MHKFLGQRIPGIESVQEEQTMIIYYSYVFIRPCICPGSQLQEKPFDSSQKVNKFDHAAKTVAMMFMNGLYRQSTMLRA